MLVDVRNALSSVQSDKPPVPVYTTLIYAALDIDLCLPLVLTLTYPWSITHGWSTRR